VCPYCSLSEILLVFVTTGIQPIAHYRAFTIYSPFTCHVFIVCKPVVITILLESNMFHACDLLNQQMQLPRWVNVPAISLQTGSKYLVSDWLSVSIELTSHVDVTSQQHCIKWMDQRWLLKLIKNVKAKSFYGNHTALITANVVHVSMPGTGFHQPCTRPQSSLMLRPSSLGDYDKHCGS